MLLTQKAFILMAVLLWQALSWVTPFVVGEQAQRLAHLVVHEEVMGHHHHSDESVHMQEADNDAVHLHADSGVQPVGLATSMAALVPLALPVLPPQSVVACPPSVCLDGLLRPPQTTI